MNKRNIIKLPASLFFIAIVITLVVPVTGLAAEPVDLNKDVTLTVSYTDETTPIAGAGFSIYKVGDIDENCGIHLTGQFSNYQINTENLDNKGWQELAMTLAGYVKRDNLFPYTSITTNVNGEFSVTVKPALYLIVGEKMNLGDYSFSPSPFMVFLPDSNIKDNTWDYNVTAIVKYTKEELPKVITRKALKIWDDDGFKSKRPESITVQLLRDGVIYDTQILNEKNLWRYTWENLPEENEWLVVEKDVSNYYTKVSLEGITFTITNKYIVPQEPDSTPIIKKIIGDPPNSPSTFTFVFMSENKSNPMPEGSIGRTKEISIVGSGSAEIGKILFTNPGVYVYTLFEKDTNAEGYTYDKTVYTLTYLVTQEKDKLLIDKTITASNGTSVDYPVFSNRYFSKPTLPQTGVLWWPIPVLVSCGLIFFLIGLIQRRQHNNERK